MLRKIEGVISREMRVWETSRLPTSWFPLHGGGWKAFCKAFLLYPLKLQVAVRYAPVLSDPILRDCTTKVLEVGSSSLGLSRYLRRPVFAADSDCSGPRQDNLILARGTVTLLPFPDDAFDLVVCVDLLEHLPRALRPRAIEELFRVSSSRLYLGFPCGVAAEAMEERLHEAMEETAKRVAMRGPYEASRFKGKFRWLEEHRRFGLPGEPETLKAIEDARRRSSGASTCRTLDNENVYIWYLTNLADLRWGRAGCLLVCVLARAIQVVRKIRRGGWYRRFFIIEKVPTERQTCTSGKGPMVSPPARPAPGGPLDP